MRRPSTCACRMIDTFASCVLPQRRPATTTLKRDLVRNTSFCLPCRKSVFRSPANAPRISDTMGCSTNGNAGVLVVNAAGIVAVLVVFVVLVTHVGVADLVELL